MTTTASDPPPYRHGATARRVLVSVVPVICPPQAHALADDIVDHMALTMGALPPLFRRGLVAGLITYDLGALLFPAARGRRAHQLAADVAERYYASWEHGPTPLHVQFARGINQLMSLSCYEQPAIYEALGYKPAGWIEQVKRTRLEVYREEIRRQDVALIAPDPLRPGVDVRALRAATRERA
jgi:hypothetical protein